MRIKGSPQKGKECVIHFLGETGKGVNKITGNKIEITDRSKLVQRY